MKRLILLIIPALICGMMFTFAGCKEKDNLDNESNKTITVSLLESDDYAIFEKTVILYEDENYLIKTPLYYFIDNINIFFLDDYNSQFNTLEKIISDGKTNDMLYSSSYFDKVRIDYVLAHFLEIGFCYFYDKKNENNIRQVVVEYWGYNSAPLSGAGGRKFYINNHVLFMETTDWIS